eukprot:gene1232-2390_t
MERKDNPKEKLESRLGMAREQIVSYDLKKWSSDFVNMKYKLTQDIPKLEETHGENHSQVALQFTELGNLMISNCKFEEGLDYHIKAAAMLRYLYPKGHIELVMSLRAVGKIYESLGRYDDAARVIMELMEVLDFLELRKSIEYAITLRASGDIAVWKGSVDEAIVDYSSADDLMSALLLNDEVTDKASLYCDIAELHLMMNRMDDSLGNFRHAIEFSIQNSEIESKRKLPDIYCAYAKALNGYDKFSEAILYIEKAINLYIKLFGDDHIILLEAYRTQGLYLCNLERFDDAETSFNQSMRIFKLTKDEPHPFIALLLSDIAILYRLKANFTQAITYHEQSISCFSKTIGADHICTIHARGLLGLTMKYQAATILELGERIVTDSMKFLKGHDFTEKHPWVVNLSIKVAVDEKSTAFQRKKDPTFDHADELKDAGKYEEASAVYEQALTRVTSEHGKNSILASDVLLAMGKNHNHLGNFTEAMGYFEQASAIRKKFEGLDSLSHAEVMHAMGDSLRWLGKLTDAAAKYDTALTIRRQTVGDDSLEVAESFYGKALLSRLLGKADEALPMFSRSLGVRKSELGFEHFLVLESTVGKASCLLLLEDAEALTLFESTLIVARKTLSSGHPFIAEILLGVIACGRLCKGADFPEQFELCEEAEDIVSVSLPPKHYRIADVKCEKAANLLVRAQIADAQTLFNDVILYREKFIDEHPLVVESVIGKAEVLRYKGDFRPAITIYQRAVDLAKHIAGSGSEHPLLAYAVEGLAQAMRMQGKDMDSIMPLFDQAYDILRVLYGSEHGSVGRIFQGKGQYLRDIESYEEAKTFLFKSLKIFEKKYGKDDLRYVSVEQDIGDLLLSQKKDVEARQYLEHALIVRKQIFGEEHPDVGETIASLAEVQRQQGKFKEAMKLSESAVSLLEKTLTARHPLSVYVRGNYGAIQVQIASKSADKKIGDMMVQASVAFLREKQFPEKHPWLRRLISLEQEGKGKRVSADDNNDNDNGEGDDQQVSELEKALRVKELDAATYLLSKADEMRAVGQYGQATPLYEQCTEMRRAILKVHSETATALFGLAENHRLIGHLDGAELAYLDCLDMRMRLFGVDSPLVAEILFGVAENLFAQGVYSEAEKKYNEALALRIQHLDPTDPELGYTKYGLSKSLRMMGRLQEAKDTIESAYAIIKAGWGMSRKESLECMLERGNVYFDLGKYAEAKVSYDQSLNLRRKILGDYHPQTAESLFKTGEILRIFHKYNDALGKYENASKILLKFKMENHTLYASVQHAKGVILHLQGHLEEALALHTANLELRKNCVLEVHSDTSDSYLAIAEIQRVLGLYPESLSSLTTCMGIRRKIFGEEHPAVCQVMLATAEGFRAQGHYDEAKELYIDANSILKRRIGKDHPETLVALQGLADYYANTGNIEEARAAYSKVLTGRRRIFGEQHPDVASALNGLAETYRLKNKLEKAMLYTNQAREMRMAFLGNQHYLYAESLNNRALLMMQLNLEISTAPLSAAGGGGSSKAISDPPLIMAPRGSKTAIETAPTQRNEQDESDKASSVVNVSTSSADVVTIPPDIHGGHEDGEPGSPGVKLFKIPELYEIHGFNEAEELFIETIGILKNFFLNKDHPMIYNVIGNLGIIRKVAAQEKARKVAMKIKRELEEMGLNSDDGDAESDLNLRMPGQDDIDRAIEFLKTIPIEIEHCWMQKFNSQMIEENSLADRFDKYKRNILSAKESFNSGHFQLAEDNLENALLIQNEYLGRVRSTHYDRSEVYFLVGNAFLAQGRLVKAHIAFSRCLEMRRKIAGNGGSPAVAEALFSYGEILRAQGKFDEARINHQEAVAMLETILGHADVSVGRGLLGTAADRRAMGQFNMALDHCYRALCIYAKYLDPELQISDAAVTGRGGGGDSPPPSSQLSRNESKRSAKLIRADSLLTTGSSLPVIDRLEALVVDIDVAIEQGVGETVSCIYLEIAHNLLGMSELKAALAYFDACHRVRTLLFGEEHHTVAESHQGIADCRREMARYKESLKECEIALAMRIRLFSVPMALEKNDVHEPEPVPVLAAATPSASHATPDSPGMSQNVTVIPPITAADNNSIPVVVDKDPDDPLQAPAHVSHPAIADSMYGRATILMAMGRYEDAHLVAQDALSMRERIFDPEHPQIARSILQVAETHRMLGQYETAKPLYAKAIAMNLRLLGKCHPIVGDSYGDSGENLQALCLLEDSRAQFEEAFTIHQNVFGVNHIRMTISMHRIAVGKLIRGEIAESKAMHESVLQIRKKYFSSHPLIADSYLGLADATRVSGDFAQASAYYEQGLSMRMKYLGRNHPEVGVLLSMFATNFRCVGKYRQAKPLVQQAMKIQRSKLQEDHPHTLDVLHGVAVNLHDRGKYKSALILLETCLSSRKELYKENSTHLKIAETEFALAETCRALAYYDRAKGYYEQSLSIFRQLFGEKHHMVASGIYGCAMIHMSLGSFVEAAKSFEEAFVMRRVIFEKSHKDLAESLYGMGTILLLNGKVQESQAMHERSLAMRISVLPGDHIDISDSYLGMGKMHSTWGKYAEAGSFFEKSLSLRRSALGDRHVAVAEAYQAVADNLRIQYKFTKVKEAYLSSLSIRQHALDVDHPDVADTMYGLASLLHVMGLYGPKSEGERGGDKTSSMTTATTVTTTSDNKGVQSQSKTSQKNMRRPSHKQTNELHSDTAQQQQMQDDDVGSNPSVHGMDSMEGSVLNEINFGDYEEENETEDDFANNTEIEEMTAVGAQPLFERALSIHKAAYTTDHPNTARTMAGLAENLLAIGRLEEAHKMVENSLSMRRKVLHDEHPDVASTMILLATVLRTMSKFFPENTSGSNTKKNLTQQTTLGEHSTSLTASPSWVRSPRSEATSKTNKKTKKVPNIGGFQGYPYPKVLTKLTRLDINEKNESKLVNRMKRSRNSDAKWLYETSIQIQNKAFSNADHPETCRAILGMAELMRARHNFDEAHVHYTQALEMSRKLMYGDLHADVGCILNGIAETYRLQCKFIEALPMQQRALEKRRIIFGNSHPIVSESLLNLSLLLYSLGRYPEAVPLAEEAFTVRIECYGERHPQVAHAMNNLAGLMHVLGKYDEARTLYEKSLEIKRSAFGPMHLEVASTLNNLALLLKAQGNMDAALPLYEQSLSIQRSNYGNIHPDVASSLNNIAALLFSKGQYEEAKPIYEESLEVKRLVYGSNHPAIASSLNNIAGLYYHLGDLEQAQDLYNQSLQIRRHAYGKLDDALPIYQKAIIVKRNTFGNMHPSLAATLNNLAGLLQSQGKVDDAKQLFEEALNIRLSVLGEDHPDTIASKENLENILVDEAIAREKGEPDLSSLHENDGGDDGY